MREGEKMEPQRRNRLLNEAVAGIPTNRKTTDGGIMGDSGRALDKGGWPAVQPSRERVDFVL